MSKIKIVFVFTLLLVITNFSFAAKDTLIVKCWILFSDKGDYKPTDQIVVGSSEYEFAKQQISERAFLRRSKIFKEDEVIKYSDFPVENSYIEKISALKINIIAKSRWLNGVSAYLNINQIEELKKLNFVSKIFAVKKLYKQNFTFTNPPFISNPDYFNTEIDSTNRFDYGKSLNQMKLVNVTKVHNLGIFGKNVMIASLDDGFEWKNHDALKNLKVVGEYDFINEDANTAREKSQKYEDSESQGGHGTGTLSSMAGFKEGELIGPAFNSEIMLAKTEYVSSETPMEEDFWLEAAEWAEANGADVITSSLVYKAFDKPFSENSYDYKDFDGNTAITSIAAKLAAHLGIVVCNATGNYYQTSPPSLGSASDADSVIGVGAVNKKGVLTSFSSNGPTSDGRIKPDVVAPGQTVYIASMGEGSKYNFADGTSFATPITAGVCALILSAHPELTAMQVRDALRNTASNFYNPDNNYGWGLIDAYKAILYFGPAWSNSTEITIKDNVTTFKIGFAANKFSNPASIIFHYRTDKNKKFKVQTMNLEKQFDSDNYSGIYSAKLLNLSKGNPVEYYFTIELNGDNYSYPKDAPLKSFIYE